MKKEIRITKTKSNIPAIWVGGGAMTNTFRARWLLHPSGNLKTAMFIKKSGPLACSEEQALVAIKVNDILGEYGGALPAELENPDATLQYWRVIALKDEKAMLEEIEEPLDGEMPFEVLEGCNTYHNRDGSKFARKKEQRRKDERDNAQARKSDF